MPMGMEQSMLGYFLDGMVVAMTPSVVTMAFLLWRLPP
jgi:hypothetical protein